MTKRLHNLFVLAIPLFIVHGLEEYFTGFYKIDASFLYTIGRLSNNTAKTFLFFQVMVWLVLAATAALRLPKRWTLALLTFWGIVMIFELHHVYEALILGGYYPGLVTALLFAIIGYFYWKELIKNYKQL